MQRVATILFFALHKVFLSAQFPYLDYTTITIFFLSTQIKAYALQYEKEQNSEIKDFLAFVRNNAPESDFTKEIATMVQTKKFQNTFLNEYLAIQLHERDVEERAEQRGIVQGIAQGITSKARESARNALALGLSATQVAQITGLSLSEIAAL